jgi:hypothetical protein
VAMDLTRSFRHNERDLRKKNSSGYYMYAIKRNDSYLMARGWDLNKKEKDGPRWMEADKMGRNELSEVKIKIIKNRNRLE